MGEAKRRQLGAASAFERLDAELKGHGIDTTQFGFYDQQTFLAREAEDNTFLEKYAQWVGLRPRDEAYDQHVRRVVPRLAEIVARALRKDGMQGGCVAASGMLTRMLDRLGVWNFGVAGSLILEVEKAKLWRGLQSVDDEDFPDAALGHSWVIAPPYRVVDAAIALQRWTGDPMGDYVPLHLVIETGTKVVRPAVGDVVSARVRARYEMRDGRCDRELHYRLQPRLRAVGRDFPALETFSGDLRLRYVPVAVRQTDVPLELINTASGIGRPAIEIWRDDVAPMLANSDGD
jgi:hypothetical protein